MNIEDITNSISNKYFDYQGRRYLFNKIVSYDNEISIHPSGGPLSDGWKSNYWFLEYRFVISFGEEKLNISSTQKIPKYIEHEGDYEYEKKKFLGFIPYKTKKINPTYENMSRGLWEFKSKYLEELNKYSDFSEYVATQVDGLGYYNYVKEWKKQILDRYEEDLNSN